MAKNKILEAEDKVTTAVRLLTEAYRKQLRDARKQTDDPISHLRIDLTFSDIDDFAERVLRNKAVLSHAVERTMRRLK